MKSILLIVTLFWFYASFGQSAKTAASDSLDNSKRLNLPDIALSPGFVFQKQAFGEINVLVGNYENANCRKAYRGVRIGAETNFRSGIENIWAPKIGLEFSGMTLCLRATVHYYISDANNQWRFLPEAGISFFGFVNLTYGYSFRLSPGTIDGISGHRVCLSVNLNPKLIRDAFRF